jgi:hypothetical protein
MQIQGIDFFDATFVCDLKVTGKSQQYECPLQQFAHLAER